MKTTDIKPLMVFAHLDTEGVLFFVDEISGEEASGRETKCGRELGNDVVSLKDLADEQRWKFIGMDPVGEALLKKRRWALRPLMVFHEVSEFAGSPDIVIDELYADAEGPHTAVCRAVGIAHPTDETPFEVKVTDLLDEKKYTFMPELTVGTMHEKIRYLQDYVRSLKKHPEVPGKLSPEQQEIQKQFKVLDFAKTLDEAKQAGLDMWKAVRHERGENCGRPCVVCAERLKAAILSCNACGASLKPGEMMVCAVCDAALGVKAEPVEGKPNTFELKFNSKPAPEPHEYVETTPYKGCGTCGFGPGAYLHNTANVAAQATRYMQKATLEKARRIQLMGRVEELKAALGDAKQGFELELPGQWPERFNVLLELEPQDPKDWTPRYDYKARPTSPLSWPAASGRVAAGTLPEGNLQVLYRDTLFGPRTLSLTVIDLDKRSTTVVAHGADLAGVNAFEVSRSDLCATSCAWCEALVDRCRSRGGRVLEPDPFKELSAVLWFLASLTSDHEPGCIVKDGKGEPCDCDVTLREGEPWWRRVRASLSLPAALKGRLEKAESLLKARRVVQVKPVAGEPGPNGDGTVYEFKMPEGHTERLLVVRYEPGTLSHQQMQAMSAGLQKKLPGVLVLFAQPNWELTLLELPK